MENLQKEFVPYELALRMKQLGFDWPCYAYIYTGDTGNNYDHYLEVKPSDAKDWNEDDLCVSVPLFQQAFRWFRDEHGMSGSIQIEHDAYQWSIFEEGETSGLASDNWDGTDYEEAELACLEKLIEIVEQNGKDKSET